MSRVPFHRIAGKGDQTYALDLEGKVWSYELENSRSYHFVWRELPMPEGSRWISDLYYHAGEIDGEFLGGALRVLTREGQIWQWQYSCWSLIWKPE